MFLLIRKGLLKSYEKNGYKNSMKKRNTGLFCWKGLLWIALLCITSLLPNTSLSSCSVPKGYAAALRKKPPPSVQGMTNPYRFHLSTLTTADHEGSNTQKGTAFIFFIIFFLTSVKNKALHLLFCSRVSNLWCQHGC